MPSRTALITAANRGIGHEIARQLAAMGIAVVLASRDLAAGEVATGGLGPDVRAEQLDVSDPGSVAACERRLTDAGMEIDILVNNAGLYTTTPLLAIEEHALIEALQGQLHWRVADGARVRPGHARSRLGPGRECLDRLCVVRQPRACGRRRMGWRRPR